MKGSNNKLLVRWAVVLFLWGMLVMGLFGCRNPESLSPKDYQEWYAHMEQEPIASKQMGAYTFDLHYQPIEAKVLEEFPSGGPSGEIQSRLTQMEGMEYYHLKIGFEDPANDILSANKGNPTLYMQIRQHLAFGIKEDFSLITQKDTLLPELVLFDAGYSIVQAYNFLLVFDTKEQTTGDKKLRYQDRVLDVGPIQMNISDAQIRAFPSLKL